MPSVSSMSSSRRTLRISASLMLWLLGSMAAVGQMVPVSELNPQAAASTSLTAAQVAQKPVERLTATPAVGPPVAKPEAEDEEPRAKSGRDGAIKVHGHWKIDVMNPDGSLAHSHQFENSLHDSGARNSFLLSGYATQGEPLVVIVPSGGGLCGGVDCFLSMNPTGFWHQYNLANCNSSPGSCTYNLQSKVVKLANGKTGLTLAGSFVALASDAIYEVFTDYSFCETGTPLSADPNSSFNFAPTTRSAVTPAQCIDYASIPQGSYASDPIFAAGRYTFTTFPDIFVVAGQTVLINVTFTYE